MCDSLYTLNKHKSNSEHMNGQDKIILHVFSLWARFNPRITFNLHLWQWDKCSGLIPHLRNKRSQPRRSHTGRQRSGCSSRWRFRLDRHCWCRWGCHYPADSSIWLDKKKEWSVIDNWKLIVWSIVGCLLNWLNDWISLNIPAGQTLLVSLWLWLPWGQ